MTKSKAFIVLAAAALITAACGGGSGSSDDSGSTQAGSSSTNSKPTGSTVSPTDMSNNQSPPEQLEIDVSITGDQVMPVNEQLKGEVGEPIVLHVSSDTEDELHVHSNPEHTFPVKEGPQQTFQFTVDVPGRVAIELHKANKTIATIDVQ